jgi:hypothetical protein
MPLWPLPLPLRPTSHARKQIQRSQLGFQESHAFVVRIGRAESAVGVEEATGVVVGKGNVLVEMEKTENAVLVEIQTEKNDVLVEMVKDALVGMVKDVLVGMVKDVLVEMVREIVAGMQKEGSHDQNVVLVPMAMESDVLAKKKTNVHHVHLGLKMFLLPSPLMTRVGRR